MQALAITTTSFTPSDNHTSALLLTLRSIASCTDSWQSLHMCIDLLTTVRSLYRRVTGPSEHHHALIIWVRQCQQEAYSAEITNLKAKFTNRSPLVHQLRLFLDTDQLIQCGGRIHNAPLSDMATVTSTQALPDITDHPQCTFMSVSCWNQCHINCNKTEILDTYW